MRKKRRRDAELLIEGWWITFPSDWTAVVENKGEATECLFIGPYHSPLAHLYRRATGGWEASLFYGARLKIDEHHRTLVLRSSENEEETR